MTLHPLAAAITGKRLRWYFQSCCVLRGRPAGDDAPRTLETAYTFLDRAARQDHDDPIARAAAARLAEIKRPRLIERAFEIRAMRSDAAMFDGTFETPPGPTPGPAA